jgi:sirohydrochlorin cobaltochelatase
MKRYRHYNKDLAIILSCFGSVVEQKRYLDLKTHVEQAFENIPVYTAFNSRMVLKLLAKKKNLSFKNTPQTLADCDMLGYRRMIVASINLFPTSEHEEIQKVVDGFNLFSLSNIRASRAIFSKNKITTNIIQEIDEKTRDENFDGANLYIVHGAPDFEQSGALSINYVKELVKALNPKNFFCSLEGSLPFYAIKDSLIRDIKAQNIVSVQIVPLLLVSGNHFDEDVKDILEELQKHFEVTIANSLTGGEKFNLIEMESVRKSITDAIKDEITKTGVIKNI